MFSSTICTIKYKSIKDTYQNEYVLYSSLRLYYENENKSSIEIHKQNEEVKIHYNKYSLYYEKVITINILRTIIINAVKLSKEAMTYVSALALFEFI